MCAYMYLDDILITGNTNSEHLINLHAVSTRLEEAGMQLKRKTTQSGIPRTCYQCRWSSTNKQKDSCHHTGTVPRDVKQLRAFLGLINYYGKFIRKHSCLLSPLYKLLEKKKHWRWEEQQLAFDKAKSQLTSSSVLVHFDPEKEIILSCDASPHGVGTVLSHQTEKGERPIAFASRTLSPTERKYTTPG